MLRLVHLANFDFCPFPKRRALDPLDRFVFRLHLPDPEARDQVLGFVERPVCHCMLAASELDARAFRARMKSLGGKQHAGFRQLFVILPHFREKLLLWESACLCVLVGLEQNHEFHVVCFSFVFQQTLTTPFLTVACFTPLASGDRAHNEERLRTSRDRLGQLSIRRLMR